jgi:hypothetical protein
MSKVHKTMMTTVLILIIALILCSIFGAFLGSARAQVLFSSLPFTVLWIVLVILLIVGLAIFKTLRGNYGLLLAHLGCILVLAGAMYGSQTGHKLFETDKICRGQMAIEKGRETSYVLSSLNGQISQLPFLIRLNDFKIEYYQSQHPDTVRDYISDVSVIQHGRPVACKIIEVNHPLHYGGYYFYQQSYDTQDGQYTILSVVSDSGLSIVYSGYLMLGVGVFWHFWLRHLARRPKDGN